MNCIYPEISCHPFTCSHRCYKSIIKIEHWPKIFISFYVEMGMAHLSGGGEVHAMHRFSI